MILKLIAHARRRCVGQNRCQTPTISVPEIEAIRTERFMIEKQGIIVPSAEK
jgi:formate-dependent phosphoribosylglycinamide formyltransferase (GAR transformylase)